MRDGSWMDEWGACRVCDGEIPHGHAKNCDIYKMEQERAEIEKVRDEWCAEYVKARNALLKIRDATEGSEDGSPDASPHDKLCNEIMGMVREVIADDDENRNDE